MPGKILWCLILSVMLLLLCAAQAQETRRHYLSGHDKDDAVPWQFFCNGGRNCNAWTTIPVPSNWELQGFGKFTYGYDLGRVPILDNAVQGKYRCAFKIPDGWSASRIFLVFEGAMTDTTARINGESAGPRHQGGFYRFKYEIGRLVKAGQENLLEVIVDEESSDSSVNAAERRGDYWNFGGIYRPVYLESVPREYIDRIALDARADGVLSVDVFADGIAKADSVEGQVLDLQGRPVGEPFSEKIGTLQSSQRLQSRVAAAKAWTAETPNLYLVEIRLKQQGAVLHRIRQRFGFRSVEVRSGDGIYLNGKRILLKGVNRHTFWPDSGRTGTDGIARDDIRLMHEMNMNAVRMSHYPPDSYFLDACDEMGMYVLDELAGWQKKYDTPIGRTLVEEMVKRDVNHPSVLFWDNGNEGGWNTALDAEFPKWDPQQRHVLHPQAKAGDIETRHYPDYARFQALCDAGTILMPTEILHGLFDGGAGSGLEDYWGLLLQSKVRGGAFLWTFVDEAVKRADLDGRLDGRGNLAPDGILGPYREKEASFFTFKEVWSPVVVAERRLPAGFDGTLTIQNRYDFLDAQQCRFSWQLRQFPRPDEPGAGIRILSSGSSKFASSLPPGAQGRLKLGLPADLGQADALALRIDDPLGRELWTWVWPLPHSGAFSAMTTLPGKDRVTASDSGDRIVVQAGELEAAFSRQSGFLTSVKRAGRSFSLVNGPRLAAGGATLTRIEHHADGRDHVVSATYSGNMQSVRWRIRDNGWIQLEYAYNLTGPQDFFGISFDYPEANVQKITWLGGGPYRVWNNRRMGQSFGVWENRYNDAVTGAGPWTYPEFKGYFDRVRWVRLETTEGPITAIIQQDDLFLQMLTPKFPDKTLAGLTAPPFPSAGISFLHAIPGMGSKFISAENSGPQGRKTIAAGGYQGSVSFYFGK
jgi:hypothetical protein